MGAPLSLTNSTYLLFTPVNPTPVLTPYAARGLSQTLEPITSMGGGGGAYGTLIQRDVNANLVDLTFPQFQKYQSTVTCRDGETPCLDSAWLGAKVTVNCVAELSYPTGGTASRPVVASRTQGSITYYRPQLIMLIIDIKNSFSEYAGLYSWALGLQEV